jgi:TRAP-type C4-dicarboxylate transport system permease small subunit
MRTFITAVSARLVKMERWVLIVLAASITLLILLNVVTRSFDVALYWVDELAIYAMIWLVMVGASATVRTREGIAVSLLENMVGVRVWSNLQLLVDVIKLLFAMTLVWLSWIWYDPISLMSAGFDTTVFSGNTFNFISDEPTLTIGVPKYLIWLIMPITAVTMTIHSAANLFSTHDLKQNV